jgi:hypothetical protein
MVGFFVVSWAVLDLANYLIIVLSSSLSTMLLYE